MRYFLDFDRTIFDTDAFVSYLFERSGKEKTALENIEEGIFSLFNKESISFEPKELAPFVYIDAATALRFFENSATILTFGDKEFQKSKVESAVAGIPRVSTLYTEGILKGEFLRDRRHLWNAEAIFVDDTPAQLESVAKHCPDIRLFEMRRDGQEGDGRWPVIRSLSDLP